MIKTLTLNPCLDKTMTFNGFKLGALNRVAYTRTDVSGKGINVSIALHQLGEKTKCLGFNYSDGGRILERFLMDRQIPYQFINVEGTLRTNVKIFDQHSRTMTELNETGHLVNNQALKEMDELVRNQADDADIMVFNGSVPEGVPKDIYRHLIEAVKRKGMKTVLDAEGELLLEGIKAGPSLIKPNLYELENAFNIKVTNKKDILKLARQIIAGGVEIVCVTLGKEGAMIVSQEEAFYAYGNDLEVKGLQGAGDSLVAGICRAIIKGLGIKEMLTYGVAAANASLIREGTLLCTKEDFDSMIPLINIEKIME